MPTLEKRECFEIKMGAILSFFSIVVYGLSGLILSPFILRKLGTAEFGIYSLAMTIFSYFTIMDFGFFNAIVRYTAKYQAEKNYNALYKLWGMFQIVYSIIGAAAFVCGILFANNLNLFFSKTMTPSEIRTLQIMLWILSLNIGMTFAFTLFSAIITACEKFILLKTLQIIRVLVNTVGVLLLLMFGFRVISIVIVFSASNIAMLLFFCIVCIKKLQVHFNISSFNKPLLKDIWGLSIFLFINAIMDRVYWSSGQFILGATVSTAAVAIYSLSISLEQIYMSCSVAISGVFLPKVSKMDALKQTDEEVSELFIKVGRIQFMLLALLISGFIVFGKAFINLLFGNGYDAVYYSTIILFSGLLIPLSQNMGLVILTARNQMKFRAKLSIFCAFFCLILQYFFSKEWGAIGCSAAVAVSLFIAQFCVMNCYYYYRQKINIPSYWKNILNLTIVPVVCIGAMLLFPDFIKSINSWYRLILYSLLFTAGYFCINWFFMNPYEKKLILTPLKKIIGWNA